MRGLIEFGGRGGVDEALDDFDETGRVVMEREMAGALKDFQPGTGHRGLRHPGVADGDHHIPWCPRRSAPGRPGSNNIGRAW